MKKNHILPLALALTALSGWGQGRVTISQDAYYAQGDSAYVRMGIKLNDAAVGKNAFVLLTPVIEGSDAAMELPPVMINGKKRDRAYRRLVALGREPVGVGNVIAAGAKDAPKSYRYAAVVPYEPWMEEANFRIREDQCECNGPITPMSFELIAGGMENRNPAPVLPERVVEMHFAASFKVPNPEPVKTRSEAGKAYLDFAAGQSEIRRDLGENASALDQIGSLIGQIKDDPYTTITQILIDGYASPEGSYATNMTISNRRAIAMKEYFKATYGLKESLFRAGGRGEDWVGLEELVEEGGMPYKQQVLEIIRSTDIFDGREKKLMDLAGGVPYRDMLANLFPQLRRSDYEIKYTVIPFTAEQGRQTIRTAPQLMSLNEIFLVAQTYEPGSEDFKRVLLTAAEQFPENDIANLNAAASAISRNDPVAALTYLEKVRERDAAWHNNMGVVMAMQGRYDEAAGEFAKAREGGNAEAVKNLSEIGKLGGAR